MAKIIIHDIVIIGRFSCDELMHWSDFTKPKLVLSNQFTWFAHCLNSSYRFLASTPHYSQTGHVYHFELTTDAHNQSQSSVTFTRSQTSSADNKAQFASWPQLLLLYEIRERNTMSMIDLRSLSSKCRLAHPDLGRRLAVQTDSPLITKRLHDESSIVDLKVIPYTSQLD